MWLPCEVRYERRTRSVDDPHVTLFGGGGCPFGCKAVVDVTGDG